MVGYPPLRGNIDQPHGGWGNKQRQAADARSDGTGAMYGLDRKSLGLKKRGLVSGVWSGHSFCLFAFAFAFAFAFYCWGCDCGSTVRTAPVPAPVPAPAPASVPTVRRRASLHS